MEKQNKIKTYDMSPALLVPTKNGRGFKVVVNGEWFYTSTQELLNTVSGKAKACNFRDLKQVQALPTTQQVVAPSGVPA